MKLFSSNKQVITFELTIESATIGQSITLDDRVRLIAAHFEKTAHHYPLKVAAVLNAGASLMKEVLHLPVDLRKEKFDSIKVGTPIVAMSTFSSFYSEFDLEHFQYPILLPDLIKFLPNKNVSDCFGSENEIVLKTLIKTVGESTLVKQGLPVSDRLFENISKWLPSGEDVKMKAMIFESPRP